MAEHRGLQGCSNQARPVAAQGTSWGHGAAAPQPWFPFELSSANTANPGGHAHGRRALPHTRTESDSGAEGTGAKWLAAAPTSGAGAPTAGLGVWAARAGAARGKDGLCTNTPITFYLQTSQTPGELSFPHLGQLPMYTSRTWRPPASGFPPRQKIPDTPTRPTGQDGLRSSVSFPRHCGRGACSASHAGAQRGNGHPRLCACLPVGVSWLPVSDSAVVTAGSELHRGACRAPRGELSFWKSQGVTGHLMCPEGLGWGLPHEAGCASCCLGQGQHSTWPGGCRSLQGHMEFRILRCSQTALYHIVSTDKAFSIHYLTKPKLVDL